STYCATHAVVGQWRRRVRDCAKFLIISRNQSHRRKSKSTGGFLFGVTMKASNSRWKEQLSGKMPEPLAQEVDNFEIEINLRKQGKLEERLFAETRLRRGAYGQRYDNGQRHDGKKVQALQYPSGRLTKGPNTLWDAPGMQRIKIPGGGLNAGQL